jgi:hypothetical protein
MFASPPCSGDLLEAEQNSSMALKRSVNDLERKVEQLESSNSSLGKQVRPQQSI